MKKDIFKIYLFADHSASAINKYCLKTSVANSRGFCFFGILANNLKSNK